MRRAFDEDEKRPEETETKPVCRFYSSGLCRWGMKCRFLHPGVTDKGNYTMFDMVRPVPLPAAHHDYRSHRPPLHHRPAAMQHHDPRIVAPLAPPEPPVILESAWKRGLRTAKEMMRKANKRKEQDMDFEDKQMNLTLSPEDVEKEPYYMKDRASPLEVGPYSRHQAYSEPDRFARGPPQMYDDIDPYAGSVRYRETPPHRMPHYEDERRVRPARSSRLRSPSPRRARRSPTPRRRRHSSPSPIPEKRAGYSPASRKRRISPVWKKSFMDKSKRKRRGTSTSASESSESSSQSRGKTPVKRFRTTDKVTNERRAIKKVEAVKKRSPISIEIKKPNIVGQSAYRWTRQRSLR